MDTNQQNDSNQPPVAQPPVTQPPKDKQTALIVGLVIAVILLLTGLTSAILYFTLTNNAKNEKSSKTTQTEKVIEKGSDKKEVASICLTNSDAMNLFTNLDSEYKNDAIAIGEDMFFFLSDSTTYEFPDQTKERITKWGEFYKDYSNRKFDIVIQASTFESSSSSTGRDLASERANKIKSSLVDLGIPASRITISEPRHSDSFDSARNVSLKLGVADSCR